MDKCPVCFPRKPIQLGHIERDLCPEHLREVMRRAVRLELLHSVLNILVAMRQAAR